MAKTMRDVGLEDTDHWIAGATPKSHRGVFKKKAQAAGESTKQYAKQEAHAPGKLGDEARLAETLMGMKKK